MLSLLTSPARLAAEGVVDIAGFIANQMNDFGFFLTLGHGNILTLNRAN